VYLCNKKDKKGEPLQKVHTHKKKKEKKRPNSPLTLGKNQKLCYDTESKKRSQPEIWSRPKPATGQLDMKYSLLHAGLKLSSPH
jgi:hypothetical protein